MEKCTTANHGRCHECFRYFLEYLQPFRCCKYEITLKMFIRGNFFEIMFFFSVRYAAYNLWLLHLQIPTERVHRQEDEASGAVAEEVVVAAEEAEMMAEGKNSFNKNLLFWCWLEHKREHFVRFKSIQFNKLNSICMCIFLKCILFTDHPDHRVEWAVYPISDRCQFLAVARVIHCWPIYH